MVERKKKRQDNEMQCLCKWLLSASGKLTCHPSSEHPLLAPACSWWSWSAQPFLQLIADGLHGTHQPSGRICESLFMTWHQHDSTFLAIVKTFSYTRMIFWKLVKRNAVSCICIFFSLKYTIDPNLSECGLEILKISWEVGLCWQFLYCQEWRQWLDQIARQVDIICLQSDLNGQITLFNSKLESKMALNICLRWFQNCLYFVSNTSRYWATKFIAVAFQKKKKHSSRCWT